MEIKIDNEWHHYHHLTKKVNQKLIDSVFIRDFPKQNFDFDTIKGKPVDATVITKKLIKNDNLKKVNNLGHIYWNNIPNFLNQVCISEDLDFLTVSFNWMGNCFGLMWYDMENLKQLFDIQDVRMIYFWSSDD
jgi:hypothetical protein